ncbi:MAG: 3-dehydroquinate synthase [Candidatus Omnitrophica bacterium]|nr:3-dehydroquinate synthase [Candidatus Omnitrophota bacterium]MDD5352283.1 3-dehydroquinate synthase [Candidatus Omnitrophota bacterium]MDD5549881.1 3-dehydroquinate synthase [Candidatus Omnitrophota bacterium]
MKIIKLKLKSKSYPIYIQQGSITKAGNLLARLKIGKDAVIITNSYLKRKFGIQIQNSLTRCGISSKFYTAPDSEKAKSIQYCLNLIDKISKYDNKKQIFLVALGGGVVGDLTGFIASIYKRGVPYIQIPTTLLAQVDSSIGGKTAIDLKVAKNLVGAFHQPKAVIVDPGLLKSLSERQLRSGLAEVIKYAIIKDKFLFNFLKNNYKKVFCLNKKAVELIEERCIAIKAQVVERDEQEKKGIRTILNFGHTIGHAIEAAAGYHKYSHGEAISIGMACATEISYNLKLIKENKLKQIINLIRLYKLPTQFKGIALNKIMNSLVRDKKFIQVRNKFVLPAAIGRVTIKNNIPEIIIRKTILRHLI